MNEDDIRAALASAMKQFKSGQPMKSTKSVQNVTNCRVVSLDDKDAREYVRSNTVANIANFVSESVVEVTVSEPNDIGSVVKAVIQQRRESIDMTRHFVPSRKETRRASKRSRSDRVFGYGVGVGSSRSATLDAIKAIAHDETGCIVLEEQFDKNGKPRQVPNVPMRATTARSATGRQIVGGLSHTAESFANLVRKTVQNDRCDGTKETK